jgi:hypothetical protein
LVRSQFEALAADQLPRYGDVPNDFDDIVRGTSNYSVNLGKARAYAERLEATLASAPRGHAFFNGKHFDMDDVGGMSKSMVLFLISPVSGLFAQYAGGSRTADSVSSGSGRYLVDLYQG